MKKLGTVAIEKPLKISKHITLSKEMVKALLDWTDAPAIRMGKMLYLASRDGFANEAFHTKVDGKGPATLIIVKTASRFLFGAFNSVPWTQNLTSSEAPKGRAEDVPTGKPTVMPQPSTLNPTPFVLLHKP